MVLTFLAQAWPLTDSLGFQVVNVDSFEANLLSLHLLQRASRQVDDSVINASDRAVEWLCNLMEAV